MLSVPTLSLGNGLRVLISLFWGDNHRAQGELGKGRTELSQLCTIKGTFETGVRAVLCHRHQAGGAPG